MLVNPWLSRRVTLGHYGTLMQELMRESRGDFKSYLRMEPETGTPYGARTAPLAPVWRPYRHRMVSVRLSCGCSREISHRRRTVSNKFFAGFATGVLRIKVCVRNEHLCTVLNSTANKMFTPRD